MKRISIILSFACLTFLQCSSLYSRVENNINSVLINVENCDENIAVEVLDSIFKKEFKYHDDYFRWPISSVDSSFAVIYNLKPDSKREVYKYWFIVNKNKCSIDYFWIVRH